MRKVRCVQANLSARGRSASLEKVYIVWITHILLHLTERTQMCMKLIITTLPMCKNTTHRLFLKVN